jgi:hypothetical protein
VDIIGLFPNMMQDPGSLGQAGLIGVVPPAELERRIAAQQALEANANTQQTQDPSALVAFIRGQYEIFRNHRNTVSGWNERLLQSLRTFNGQYNEQQLMEIRKFGGSMVYARIGAQKCRAASSLLRDIYLGQDRPYAVKPPTNPDPDPQVLQQIEQLLGTERQMVQQGMGRPPNAQDEWNRREAFMTAAEQAAQKKANEQARDTEDRIEDMLRSGGFYQALNEFIVDLPVFPFAVMKGPVVKILPEVVWPPGGGQPQLIQKPTLTWTRVSPFDIWFTPGVGNISNANIIEKQRLTRGEINDLLDLPGYDQNEVRAVLQEYGRGGLYDNWDTTDAERAVLESSENPAWNRSGLINMMEFNGNIQGQMLQDYGIAVPDALRDYHVQIFCIGNHVIKAHLSPSPRQRHPYYMTSFEKVPGTPVGNSLLDLVEDLQEAANATLRSTINNLAIASGPQVLVNDDRLSPDDNGDDLYPWKRWHVRNDPLSGAAGQPPVSFFQPQAITQELTQFYQFLGNAADDVSAIPKYIGGQAGGGGAGRTASGLAMLMGNASKILQTVSSNIDREVIEPAFLQLTDLIMLTDTTGLLNGEQKVTVQGVSVAVQRETLRQRQLEFLQGTNNPTDLNITGIKGRGIVLRSVAQGIGIDGETIVPDDDTLDKMQAQHMQQQAAGPVMQQIQKGVAQGVQQGVQTITKELTAGEIAQNFQMPEGVGVHIGTLPGGGAGTTSNPAMNAAAPNNLMQGAAVAQGTQPKQLSAGGMAPQTSLTGNMRGPGAAPLSPGMG